MNSHIPFGALPHTVSKNVPFIPRDGGRRPQKLRRRSWGLYGSYKWYEGVTYA